MPAIAQFGRLAYPVHGEVTTRVLPGWRSHSRHVDTIVASVGAVRVASKPEGLKSMNDDVLETASA